MSTTSEILQTRTATAESAVAWSAVFAGAAGAAALSLVLLLLGTGLGLAVVSPWATEGISAEAMGWSTILWITLVQSLASVLGGYLAGRLRTRWTSVHTDEVFFRDTAHGFLAWAVATLLMASLMSAAITATLSTGVKAAGSVAGSAVAGTAMAGASAAASAADEGQGGMDAIGYYVDLALRGSAGDAAAPASATPSQAPPQNSRQGSSQTIGDGEVARAFAHAIANGELPAADAKYLGSLVAARTGLSQADAEQRVTEAFNQLKSSLDEASAKARQAADDARKASALAALWLVVSLLLGAFLASFAATFGGRLRDSSVLQRT